MKDFAVDEKLLKEVRDLCSPLTKEEFPEKLKKVPVRATSIKISENALYKKEKNDLEHKFKNLEKNWDKVNKKNTDLIEELKLVKTSYENVKKDLNVLNLTNEKIHNEKICLEKTLEENKSYIRKLESRLLQGSKNQHLVEINNKLRKEIEEYKIDLDNKNNEIEKLKNSFEKKNQEIRILNKALEIKADDLKFKGDIKSSILYDVGMCKQEIDEYKEKYQIILEKNDGLKAEIQEKVDKIQELLFSKQHLTEMLVECENKNHNLELEKESFVKHCSELNDERDVLKDYVDKLSTEIKSLQEKISKETQENKQRIYTLEEKCMKLEDISSKALVENSVLKQQLDNSDERIKFIESSIKKKNNELSDLEIKYNSLAEDFKSLDDLKESLKFENEELQSKMDETKNALQELEKENIELIKKNKNLISSQENIQKEAIKQNQSLSINEQKLKEQLTKNIQELDYLKEERENLKKIMNEAVNKCSFLIKEKNDLERELINKNNQIENLKNSNHLLHRNLVKNNHSISKLEESKTEESLPEEKIIKLGESKLEETSLVKLIRREKEKNKEILEEIRKIKNNINNLN